MKMLNLRLTKQILFYIFIYCLICLSIIAYNTIDMDYWARLLQGNAFWELGHILRQDPFSYVPTHIWIDHEWGSSVIFSLIQNTFGFKGILIFRSIIIFLLFFFTYKTIKLTTDKTNNTVSLLLFISAAFSMPTLIQSGLRCHFFTFLFFCIFLYILEKVRNESRHKLLIILPFLMLIWANVHGGCVSGLGLLIVYSIGEFLNKKPIKYYLLSLFTCCLMMFINPYGIDYVKFIFMAVSMPRPFVTEWISPFTHNDWSFMILFKIFYITGILLFVLNLIKAKFDYTKCLLLAVCAYLSFKYIKNTPFFIIVSLVFFYEYISLFLNKFLNSKFVTYIIYLCSFAIFLYPTVQNVGYSYLSEQPVREAEFIKINDLKGNILAPFDMGSYLVYKLYPNNLIYMDGRYEEVYYSDTKKELDDFFNIEKENYYVLDKNISPDYIIVPLNALVNDYLLKRDDYKLIYRNDENVIYSQIKNLKTNYILPSNDYSYYTKNAFKTNFTFSDDITVNGQKVIFR